MTDPASRDDLTWAALERALADAEEASRKLRGGMHAWYQAQAMLLYTLGNPELGYWQLTQPRQQAVVARVIPLVQRIGDAVNPRAALESIFYLYRHPQPFEEMVRAVKVGVPAERPLEPGELIYKSVGGWLGEFLNYAGHSDVPLGYYFWAGVSTLGAACRHGWFADRMDANLRMNQYVIMVGRKATGKSSALNASLDLIRRCNYQINEWHRELNHRDKTFEEGHPWHIRILPEDTNQETLVELMASFPMTLKWPEGIQVPADPPQTIMRDATAMLGLDEVATFLGRQGWMVEKRIPWLTTMYGRPDYVYQTKSGGRKELKNIAMSMLGCCTPDWMRDVISPLMFGGGFMDRTVVVYRDPLVQRTYPTPEPRDPVQANYLARYLKGLSCRLRPQELYPEHHAIDWYNDWYREYPEPADDQNTSVKRTANHLWKLACLLAISDESQPVIKLKHFELAWRLLAQEEQSFNLFLGYIRRPTEMDAMEFIERKLFIGEAYGLDPETQQPRFMMQSELFNHLRQRVGLSPPNPKALPFLESLEGAGRIEKLVGAGRGPKGRRGTAYRLVDGVAQDWLRRERPGQPDETLWVSRSVG